MMTYQDWIEYAVVEFDVVSKNYNQKVYENIVEDPKTHERKLVQMTLREVLNKCSGTNYEDRIKRAVMKCVYTEANLEKEVRRIMNPFFEA
ncbi:MAG: hypothetical protein NC180_04245 [Muribaculaceae bacterium]|nr:hypothetical protein [Roseburia sp.]MCM1430386.1 hypothetical protein [Muribaculaceae bacterium]MCM1492418.1 hypothetical protein [Muribaculaceae bacterium]